MADKSASEQIDDIIKTYGGWKGDILAKLRAVITQADPTIVEEIKWKMPTRPEGLPVWTHDGIVCLAETFKYDIKLTFPKGVHLKDSKQLFNARLKSKTDRAIEFREDSAVDEAGLKELVIEAAELNVAKTRSR